jgi:predicted alpha/beta superfamily hydrolase
MSDHSRARERRPARLIAVLFALISPKAMTAQESSPPQPVTIANTERRVLRSQANGIEYQIDVALPRGYATSQKRYPVIYTLDGNVFFPVLAASYRLTASLLPTELIVVGIGYPASEYGGWSRENGASRARDYTPRPAKQPGGISAGAGGAPAFLRFLRAELIPFIDSAYRTVPGDRGLWGHSYGGLFGAYVLTHEPDLFQKYAIGSPALWWDNEAGLKWEAEYAATHTELPARVYMYIGELEDGNVMKRPARRFWEALKARRYTGLDLADFVAVPDEIHSSVLLVSMEHALRSLYARRSVSLPVETLNRYVGEWKEDNGRSWAIRLNRDRLVIDIPSLPDDPMWTDPESRELLAESDSSFFSPLGDLKADFVVDARKQFATEFKISGSLLEQTFTLRRAPATAGNGVPK